MQRPFSLLLRIRGSLALCLALGCALGCATPGRTSSPLPTRAERSGFTETSRYEEVMEFLEILDGESEAMDLRFFGKSAEGRPLPLVILGSPAAPGDPRDIDPGRTTVIFINANIHAGEVAGKEACLLLIRDLVRGPLKSLLEKTVVLIAPIYNADGNERIDPSNRSRQEGPEGGVGIRTNAQYLDLNRDMMKLESPEAQSMVQNILARWNPLLVVDCHTTNGSYHREPITYAPPHNPLCDQELLYYNTSVMLPWIAQETLKRDQYAAVPYGNFRDAMNPESGWYTFDHRPRFVTNYIGLRNRFSILIEMYAYAPYEIRIKACLGFLRSIVEFAHLNGKAMRSITDKADGRFVEAGKAGQIPLVFHHAFERKAYEDPITIQGYRMAVNEDARGRRRPQPNFDEPVDYIVPYHGLFTPSGEGSPLPGCYAFQRGLIDVKEKLLQHGIRVEEVKAPFTVQAKTFEIEAIEAAENLYQGHRLEVLKGRWEEKEVTFPGGAFLVPASQPLAMLAAYLLEPESDDSLATWNLLDRYLTRGSFSSRPGTYPIVKLDHPLPDPGSSPDP